MAARHEDDPPPRSAYAGSRAPRRASGSRPRARAPPRLPRRRRSPRLSPSATGQPGALGGEARAAGDVVVSGTLTRMCGRMPIHSTTVAPTTAATTTTKRGSEQARLQREGDADEAVSVGGPVHRDRNVDARGHAEQRAQQARDRRARRQPAQSQVPTAARASRARRRNPVAVARSPRRRPRPRPRALVAVAR